MNQKALQAKKDAVNEIVTGFEKAGSFTVVSYQGLTVAELQELRKTLEGAGSTFTVYKNTMVRRALKEANQPDLGNVLEGPNGFVFSEDISKGPKALAKFSRFHEHLVIKGGIAEGQTLDAAKVKEIAKLPDKNGLISMFLSCLNAPITKFAATVKAIADKQNPEAETPAAN